MLSPSYLLAHKFVHLRPNQLSEDCYSQCLTSEWDPWLEWNISFNRIRGHSTTTWTNFDPILTPSPPRVDKRGILAEWIYEVAALPKIFPDLYKTASRHSRSENNLYRHEIYGKIQHHKGFDPIMMVTKEAGGKPRRSSIERKRKWPPRLLL